MSVDELTVRAQLVDELSAGLGRIKGEVDALKRSSTSTGSSLKSRLGGGLRFVGRGLRGFASVLKRAGIATLKAFRLAVIGAGVALAALAVASVKAAIEAQNVAAQTRAAIKSTGGVAGVTAKQVDQLGRVVLKYSGIDDELVKGAENILLTFPMVRNELGKGNDIFYQATKAAADLSVRFGTDMRKSALQLGKALQDPVKGVTALRRVGVAFSAAQTDQIKRLVEHNHLLDAQKLILREVRLEVGGSARAAGKTAAGQWNIFKESIKNAMETVGRRLFPVLKRLLPVLTKVLVPAIRALGPPVTQVVEALGRGLAPVIKALAPSLKILGKIFAAIATALSPILVMLGQMLARALRMLLPALLPFIRALGAGLLTVLRELKPYLPDLVGGMVDLLVAVTPLLHPLAKLTALILKVAIMAMLPLIKVMTKYVVPAINWLARKIAWLSGHWSEAWASMKHAAGEAVDWIIRQVNRVTAPFRWLDDKIGGIIDAVRGPDIAGGIQQTILDQISAFHRAHPGAPLPPNLQKALGTASKIASTHTGDTARSRAGGGNLARTLAWHNYLDSVTPGQRSITSARRSWGNTSGDHPAGRALDLVGSFGLTYARNLRAMGGFAEAHGSGANRHIHGAYGDTARSRAGAAPSMGGDGAGILINGPLIAVETIESAVDLQDATRRAIRVLEREADERAHENLYVSTGRRVL